MLQFGDRSRRKRANTLRLRSGQAQVCITGVVPDWFYEESGLV